MLTVQVLREKEVKAQIKLKFVNIVGKPIVCTRSLQLTQKANAQQIKTLEGALQTYNSKGEVQVLVCLTYMNRKSVRAFGVVTWTKKYLS